MKWKSTIQRTMLTAGCLALVALAGCQSASDAPSGSAGPVEALPASSLQIEGLERLRTVARVVSNACRMVQFETDRRRPAQSRIFNALAAHANALPGGLKFEVQSLDIRMRCLGAECISGATLTALATGKDKRGTEVRIQSTSEASDTGDTIILCTEAMPAVTNSVDKALEATLADISRRLSSHTGIAGR